MQQARFAAEIAAVAHVLVPRLDASVTVAGDDGHHLARARRLRPGEIVTAADGVGSWRVYVVDRVQQGSVVLSAEGRPEREPELAPGLTVAFALTKGLKPEVVVRQLTELGVDRVLPVVGERSVARPVAERAPSGTARLARIAREAAMQSRRARVPDIGPTGPLRELLGAPGLVVADRVEGPSVVPEPAAEGWTLLVGPEGGFSQAEVDALAHVPRLAVGVHVLRAETAAVAATAVLTARRTPVPPPPQGP